MEQNLNRKYWLYRIDRYNIPFFWSELREGRLRQGWGWSKNEDLSREPRDFSTGNKYNYPIFDSVKRGDILLVPHLPVLGKVALVEVSDDFNIGYKFEFSKEKPDDFGHCFPAKYLKSFVRANSLVSGELRKNLKYLRRFKSIYYEGHKKEIEKILETEQEYLNESQNADDRNLTVIANAFSKGVLEKIKNDIYKYFNKQLNAGDWEYALLEGLKRIYPEPFYTITRVGGKKEAVHGTDILVTIKGLISDHNYAIAIQVKDYDWVVRDDVLSQIGKADYWNTQDGIQLIDRILLLIRSKKEHNSKLQEAARNAQGGPIQIIFANDLKQLLFNIAIGYLGIDSELNY